VEVLDDLENFDATSFGCRGHFSFHSLPELRRHLRGPRCGASRQSAANPSHLIPVLNGLDAAIIFKQLSDYRSGKRSWGVMNGIGKALDVQASADVAVERGLIDRTV